MNRIVKMKIMNSIITLITSLLLFTLSASAIAMTTMGGSTVQLQDKVGQGKWTVAKVWASDCHACQQSIHYLSEFKQKFPEADVLGISIDGQNRQQHAQRFIDRFELAFPNLLSDAMELDDYLYAAVGQTLLGTPTMIVYDPQGKITAVQPGAVKPDDLIRFIKSKAAEAVATN